MITKLPKANNLYTAANLDTAQQSVLVQPDAGTVLTQLVCGLEITRLLELVIQFLSKIAVKVKTGERKRVIVCVCC